MAKPCSFYNFIQTIDAFEMQSGEDYFKQLFHYLPTGFAFCKLQPHSEHEFDFEIQECNPSFSALIGLPKTELTGKRFIDIKNDQNVWISRAVMHLAFQSTNGKSEPPSLTLEINSFIFKLTYVKETGKKFSLLIEKNEKKQRQTGDTNFSNLPEDEKLRWREQNRKSMLEMIAEGQSIDRVLFCLAKSIEDEHVGALCAIMIYDKPSNAMKHITAPGLPEFYNKFIDELSANANSDFRNQVIFSDARKIISDIHSDPVWQEILPVTQKAGLGACWTEPILSVNGQILGVISIYHKHPHYPEPDEIESVEFSIDLARIIIEKKSADNQLNERVGRFRNMVETSQAGYFYIDLQGNFKFVNQAWLRINKYEYLYEVVGKNISMVIPEPDNSRFFQTVDRMLKRNTSGSGEFLHKCKDGTMGYHTMSANPVIKSGKITGIEGFIIDVSSYHLAINSLTVSEKKSKEIYANKDKFLSIIAHDLKTPFTGILGFSHLLIGKAQELDLNKVKQYSQIIYESAYGCHLLLENLLQWSRAQSGSVDFSPELFRINDVVNETLRTTSITLLSKKIQLENNIEKDIMVFADQKMISTILRNLLSNAMKFTKRDGKISLDYELTNQFVKISVSDTGVGMSRDKIEKIFSAHVKLSTPGTGNEQGTGLGLMICREFISLNNGELWVESQVGKGSKFQFTVPRYPSGYEVDE